MTGKELKKLIRDNGLRIDYVAKELGISYNHFCVLLRSSKKMRPANVHAVFNLITRSQS